MLARLGKCLISRIKLLYDTIVKQIPYYTDKKEKKIFPIYKEI